MTALPSREWAFELMDERAVPAHIRRHCLMVARVALATARALNQRGHQLDLGLIETGALLHDVCKYDSILAGGDHARMAAELLEQRGYPAVAAVVAQHVRLASFDLSAALVVNYADKRVKHDAVVSLDERFEDLLVRYGSDALRQSRIRELYEEGLAVERLICQAAAIEPASLNRLGLIAADDAFDGGGRVGRQHAAVEIHDQDV